MDQNNNNNEASHEHVEGDGHDHGASNATASTPVPVSPVANDDISDHKLYAILGYILPFLFFLPLVQESSKNNPFARFHANQQLILLILCVGVYMLGNVLTMIIGYAAYSLLPILNLVLLVLAIMGIIHAVQGETKELPVVGKYKILK